MARTVPQVEDPPRGRCALDSLPSGVFCGDPAKNTGTGRIGRTFAVLAVSSEARSTSLAEGRGQAARLRKTLTGTARQRATKMILLDEEGSPGPGRGRLWALCLFATHLQGTIPTA